MVLIHHVLFEVQPFASASPTLCFLDVAAVPASISLFLSFGSRRVVAIVDAITIFLPHYPTPIYTANEVVIDSSMVYLCLPVNLFSTRGGRRTEVDPKGAAIHGLESHV